MSWSVQFHLVRIRQITPFFLTLFALASGGDWELFEVHHFLYLRLAKCCIFDHKVYVYSANKGSNGKHGEHHWWAMFIHEVCRHKARHYSTGKQYQIDQTNLTGMASLLDMYEKNRAKWGLEENNKQCNHHDNSYTYFQFIEQHNSSERNAHCSLTPYESLFLPKLSLRQRSQERGGKVDKAYNLWSKKYIDIKIAFFLHGLENCYSEHVNDCDSRELLKEAKYNSVPMCDSVFFRNKSFVHRNGVDFGFFTGLSQAFWNGLDIFIGAFINL